MEKVAGIIAEYNPFHRGHQYHIAETRRLLGADCGVVCVQSGDFVQRGEAALWPKHLRAGAAVRGGADLVLELPLPWCVSSAEGFARGGVSALCASGVVTHLSFGSESGDLAALQRAAGAKRDPAFSDLLRRELQAGVSYPRAQELAVRALIGDGADVLALPNDTLALEYLLALSEAGGAIEPVAVRRVGAGHDEAGEGAIRSASELRELLLRGEDASAFLPPEAAALFETPAVDPAQLETAVLSRLRMLPQEAWANVPGAEEGLENVMYRAVRGASTLEGVLAAAKSKRYPLSRLRRLALCAALGVTKDLPARPPYLRVLAANDRGRALLREMREKSALPVITKSAAANDLPEDARRIFALNADAHDLYVLACADRSPGQDWRKSPEIL